MIPENLARSTQLAKRPLSRNPILVVNLCFLLVVLCSTLLTWREVMVLENAYMANQRSSLDSIATALDRHLQYSVDKLQFYRSAMLYALQYPQNSARSRELLRSFTKKRERLWWQIQLDPRRSVPVRGVSDEVVRQSPLLVREEPYLTSELGAVMELSYILQAIDPLGEQERHISYVSRSGFYLSTLPEEGNGSILSRYYHLVTRPYFTAQSPQNNPLRGVRWSPHQYGQLMTASIPLDYLQRWYGVLSINFTFDSLREFLRELTQNESTGEILLYDRHFSPLISTAAKQSATQSFTPAQQAQLKAAFRHGSAGDMRIGTRFISWARLSNFDGVLVRVNTLRESVSGDIGHITLVLTLLWLLFIAMVFSSWIVIRRVVRNMYQLQNTLRWRASYDALTHLFNRGTLFERAQQLLDNCKQRHQPCAIIQLDLDHFKNVNDTYGHQAGDRVLSHTAGILCRTLGEKDIAGRVGGEEFTLVLPGATKAEATVMAECIRSRISAQQVLIKNSTAIHINASFGVSAAAEDGDYHFELLQSVADRRLYRAKQRGRNRVMSED